MDKIISILKGDRWWCGCPFPPSTLCHAITVYRPF